MSTLAPTLQAFFTDRLARQRQASPHTIAAYRDTVKLLLVFAEQRTGKTPSDIRKLASSRCGAMCSPGRRHVSGPIGRPARAVRVPRRVLRPGRRPLR